MSPPLATQEPFWPSTLRPDDSQKVTQDGTLFDRAPAVWPLTLPPNIRAPDAPAPMVPNMLPYHTAPPSTLPVFAPTSYNPYPCAYQYQPISPHLHHHPRSLQGSVGLMTSPRSATGLPVGAAPWTNSLRSPISTFTVPNDGNAGQKRSRLPPDNIARKAPRRADDRVMTSPPRAEAPSAQVAKIDDKIGKVEAKVRTKVITGRVAKSAKERKRKTSATPTPRAKSTKITKRDAAKPRKPAQPEPEKSATETRDTATPAPNRRKRVVKDEDDDESDVPLRTMRRRRVLRPDDDNECSTQPTEDTEALDRARHISQTPQVKPPPHIEPTSIRPPLTHKPLGPVPRCKYEVPDTLKGVQQAMGPDNWNEYVVLLEKLWAREVHGEDFAAASRAMFRITGNDDITRKKLNSRIMKMIAPMLHKWMVEHDKGKGMQEKEVEMGEAGREEEGQEKEDIDKEIETADWMTVMRP